MYFPLILVRLGLLRFFWGVAFLIMLNQSVNWYTTHWILTVHVIFVWLRWHSEYIRSGWRSWWWWWRLLSRSSWSASRNSWSWSRDKNTRACWIWWIESEIPWPTYESMSARLFFSWFLTFLYCRTKESIGRQEKLKEEQRHRLKVFSQCDLFHPSRGHPHTIHLNYLESVRFPSKCPVLWLKDPESPPERGGAAASEGGRAGTTAAGWRQREAAEPQLHSRGNPAAQPASGTLNPDSNRCPIKCWHLQHSWEPIVLPGVRGCSKDSRGQCKVF